MDVAEQRARTITIDGNRLTPIIEGPEILAALMKLIDEAKTLAPAALLHLHRRPDGRPGQGRA